MRARAVMVVLCATLGVTLAVSTVAGGDAGAATGPPPGTPVAHSFPGTPTVGGLFRDGLAGGHSCTASVVHSYRRDVVLTAAHCVRGTGAGDLFVPGYRDGRAPYGVWTVTGGYADHGWLAGQDPDRDWVFLVVRPQRRAGRMVHVEDVVGGNRLGFAAVPGRRVTVPAYPAGVDDRPITCTTTIYRTAEFPAFDCDGYVGGTSGSPWLTAGAVVGVIGGLHQGGCVAWTSYSPPLGLPAWRAYLRAVIGAPTDTLPAPGGDGC